MRWVPTLWGLRAEFVMVSIVWWAFVSYLPSIDVIGADALTYG
jgi:hypothetical protein